MRPLSPALGFRLLRARYLLAFSIVLAIVAGALFYYYLHARTLLLPYFFLPVMAGAALSGRIKGVAYALLTIVLVGGPALYWGSEFLHPGTAHQSDELATLGAWLFLLPASAFIVGWVSELGGNRLLVMGLGADAMNAVERERKRMAFDIHDGIAQTANTALMQAEVLEMLAEEADPELRSQIRSVRDTASTAVSEIRTMIGQLRPPALSASEFPATLNHLIEDFVERTDIKIEFDLAADLSGHSDSVRICVFRVMQEALSNVQNHAKASRAYVGLNEARGGVFLTIRDDGVGFEVPPLKQQLAVTSQSHHGLAGMQERVWLLTGRIEIESRPQEGTAIRAFIPRYQA